MADAAEGLILALARRQQGNITRKQLLSLGLGPSAIDYRARTNVLFRVHLGVYGVGRPPSAPLERAAAAVLACGSGALLSHESARTLWGLTKRWRTPFHVTVAVRRRRPAIILHRAAGLARRDIRRQLGIPVTSPARTFLDCAPRLPPRRLNRLVSDARLSGLLHPSELTGVVRRYPRHPGSGRLVKVIERLSAAPTRSDFEDDFPVFCQRYGLPTPRMNAKICGYEVDALFEAEGVIVELDSWEFHQDRNAFERDRNRDADTLAAGLATIRITSERFREAPSQEAERLRRILEREGASRASARERRSAPRT